MSSGAPVGQLDALDALDARLREFAGELFDAIFRSADVGICVTDARRRFVAVNDAYCRTYGYPRAALIGEEFTKVVLPEQWAEARRLHDAFLAGGRESAGEWTVVRADGVRRQVLVTAARIELRGQRFKVTTVTDIQERVDLERQLRQAGKMESIGRLAGGLAHDFNNMLTAIFGFLDLLEKDLQRGLDVRSHLAHVRQAANEAAAVTHHLLSFAHTSDSRAHPHDLNELLRESRALIRQLVGDAVRLAWEVADEPAVAVVDPSEFKQAVLNLASNARDAMASGGTLRVRTDFLTLLEGSDATGQRIAPGSYASVEIRDSGIGMEEPVLSRIFDPFFTTKPTGAGTGLGLAQVYGFARRYDVAILVDSTPGAGTSVRLLFPLARGTEGADDGADRVGIALVVEDEPLVHRLTSTALRSLGFEVLSASNAELALELLDRHGGRPDVLVADLQLPGMGGADLARHVERRHAGVGVIFTSGSTPRPDLASARATFLAKPWTLVELERAIARVIDWPGAPGA